MGTTLDADLELLGAAARRHIATLHPQTSVHVSAAVDALTDPLAPPRLSDVDDADTAEFAEVLRAVRRRLLHAAQHTGDVQRTIAIAFAARELTHALATLTADLSSSSEAGRPAAPAGDLPSPVDGHDDGPARAGRPGR